MAGKPVGTIFAELALDTDKYTAAQRRILRESSQTALNVEKNWRVIGQKSDIMYDAMRQRITNAYNAIKHKATSSAQEIVRAEKAAKEQIKRIDEQQHGRQMSMIDSIRKHWLGLTATIYLAVRAIQAGWDMMEKAAKAEQQRVGFENLARSYGTSADSILSNLKRISGGTLDTITMIEKAGTAMMLGIAPDKIIKLMEIARASSRVTGQAVGTAFSDIAMGVGRQSKMILDNLGIIVSVERANTEYAKSIGKTAAALVDAEKKTAFMNATIQAGEELMRRTGNQADTNSDKMARYTASVSDFALEIGKLALALTPLVELTTKAIEGFRILFGIGEAEKLLKKQKDILSEITTLETDRASKFTHVMHSLFGQEEVWLDNNNRKLEVLKLRLKLVREELVKLTKPEIMTAPSPKKTEQGLSHWFMIEPEIFDGIDKATAAYNKLFDTFEEIGPSTFAGMDQAAREYSDLMASIKQDTKETFADDMKNAVTGWASNFSSTLTDMVWGAERSFNAIATSFGKMITQIIIQKKVVEPLLLWGFGIGSAQGNAFAGGGINAYENKIISKPTVFPFAKGIGLMGEGSRPEAVMPLTRTKSGDLGVKTEAGGGSANIQYIDISGSTFFDKETMAIAMSNIAMASVQKYASQAIINDYDNAMSIRDVIRGGK